jgi:ribosomal-protein-alanine N-acetyltransferase
MSGKSHSIVPPEAPNAEVELVEAAGAAARLAAEAFDAHYREAWTEAQIAGLLKDPGGWLELRWLGADLVAFALSRQVADEVELLLCATAPAWRRRGVGRTLVDRVAATARSRGARRLFLEVRATNAPALALYAACGFDRVGRRPAYYRTVTGAVIDAITLARPL